MKKQKFTIKKDKFLEQRGGTTKIIELLCIKCKQLIFIYQKDGPGWLKRCYLNRILFPEKYASLQDNKQIKEEKNLPDFVCKCGSKIGIPSLHAFRTDGITPDGRLAYELIRGSFSRQAHKQ